jgi:signal transduction histidine kinase
VTPAGSTVALAARTFGTGVVIEVRDGGPGLSPDDLAVAFERGALQARYRDIRPVGTGLGLSIAARLVSRLGGSIAAGNAPAGGAVFAVSLPAA